MDMIKYFIKDLFSGFRGFVSFVLLTALILVGGFCIYFSGHIKSVDQIDWAAVNDMDESDLIQSSKLASLEDTSKILANGGYIGIRTKDDDKTCYSARKCDCAQGLFLGSSAESMDRFAKADAAEGHKSLVAVPVKTDINHLTEEDMDNVMEACVNKKKGCVVFSRGDKNIYVVNESERENWKDDMKRIIKENR